jgi:hypothetical protein
MSRIRYKKDLKGTNELMRSPGVRDFLRSVAEAAIPVAESISPERTGDYKESFRVETGEVNQGGLRAAAFLRNVSDHAVLVEWHDGYHVLARVAGMIGKA